MRNCGFNIFEDCNCGGHCKSATIPLGRFTKAETRTLRAVTAKDNAGAFIRYLKVAGASCIALAIISLTFVYAAIPESNRLAKRNQEQVAIR